MSALLNPQDWPRKIHFREITYNSENLARRCISRTTLHERGRDKRLSVQFGVLSWPCVIGRFQFAQFTFIGSLLLKRLKALEFAFLRADISITTSRGMSGIREGWLVLSATTLSRLTRIRTHTYVCDNAQFHGSLKVYKCRCKSIGSMRCNTRQRQCEISILGCAYAFKTRPAKRKSIVRIKYSWLIEPFHTRLIHSCEANSTIFSFINININKEKVIKFFNYLIF